MEVLGVLEKKIASLLDFVNKLKAENELLRSSLEQKTSEYEKVQQQFIATQEQLSGLQVEYARLVEEHTNQKDEIAALKGNLETYENSMLQTKTSIEEYHQEKALTKMLVDDLISSIDTLVEQEQ